MKIHHIGYAVKNIKSSINEFLELGFKKCGDLVEDTGRNIVIQFISNQHYTIELIAPLN